MSWKCIRTPSPRSLITRPSCIATGREAGEVEERDGGLHARALGDVAGIREHLLGGPDAVVVDRAAHVTPRQPFGKAGQIPSRRRPRNEYAVVDLLGRH